MNGKQASAKRAVDFVEAGSVLGVGTGSTVVHFIEALGQSGIAIDAAVSSSEATSRALAAIGIRIVDLNAAGPLDLYIDGADEFDPAGHLIKGGGGALTREKIIAQASRQFICIVDTGKRVSRLGRFPLPVEVIPMARSLVARRLAALGGQPVWRDDVVTDNGGWILDVHGLAIDQPADLEREIDSWPGVVSCGLFARRRADLLIVDGEPEHPQALLATTQS